MEKITEGKRKESSGRETKSYRQMEGETDKGKTGTERQTDRRSDGEIERETEKVETKRDVGLEEVTGREEKE